MADAEQVGTRRDLQHLTSVLLGGLGVAAAAAWVAGELASPVIVFLAVAVMTGYLLDQRRGERAKLVLVGYAVAALLAVSPVLFVLPDVLAGRTGVLSQHMTVVVTRLLLLVAGILAYGTYRLDGGVGVLARARDPGRRRPLVGYLVAAVVLVAPVILFVVDLVAGTNLLDIGGTLGWRLSGILAVGIAFAASRVDDGSVGVR